MQTKHTPGPWRFTAALGGAIFGAPLDGGGVDARLIVEARHVRPNNSADRAYDLCLIAAAPELLSALEGLMAAYGGVTSHAQQRKWDEARAAIAKARGED